MDYGHTAPMAIPPHVAEAVREDPTPHRATGRGTHWVMRYGEPGAGAIYLFRSPIPAHRKMIGEIVRTDLGRIRVHCWSAADPERYTRDDEPLVIVERKLAPMAPAVVPPADPPQPAWDTDYVADLIAENS